MPLAAAGITIISPSQRGADPSPVAPLNVFVHRTLPNKSCNKAWTNYYELPVDYTVEMYCDILNPKNPALATRYLPTNLPDGVKRRFLVIDEEVNNLYGERIQNYFKAHGVVTRTVILPGEEQNKRFWAVEKIFEELCDFGLLRREPILAIGGGVVLDIVGFTASIYRRGVPYIRIPTTLLAIVDASVGVKCGVDYVSKKCGALKNRMGSFYPPIAAFLDKSFIATQDERNLVNGVGEIMKLALVRSPELFQLLDIHGERVIKEKFQGRDAVAERIIELSIQIMLEELGPNLWEYKLERCVDYGHTFSKIIEMEAKIPIMHGEAVNVDGFFCVLLSHLKGWITKETRDEIFKVMKKLKLPTTHETCVPDILWVGVRDGIEHRHGKLRMPLVRGEIGKYDFVNDLSYTDIQAAVEELHKLHQDC
eukprot:Plantae.Rhodophyta-Hildenbrandia_rubra.ctg10555.p1 GENE.Plantae.Rhodophyta-Hildenbrandia_rubra.ctg10555~~Plantae.Rhodophyta-Hildenbrandia_rubra.ctg10555.p1  ORF type:complete len:423 (+),score=66.81 Plantae.Rhodophyta-Hildenbrandia_rubra.ctg10555:806-2074(+)